MPDLRACSDLPVGGIVVRDDAPRGVTGGWRTAGRPVADMTGCVNCLLCWLYCPDSAVIVVDGVFEGFDYDVCKGCEICVEMCPPQAIAMEAE